MLKIVLDVGSTTVKVAVVSESDDILFTKYLRHFSRQKETVQKLLNEVF